ncbi:MAG: galactokinase, partial [Candidatus Sericytochromatia bacterium]|nr:galactokinase [Candidatus Sericytochromatia bacterium]
MKIEIKESFIKNFNKSPFLFRSPGRVNMIGEHTDYNQGFVLPAAIDKETIVAISPNNTDRVRIYSYDMQEKHEFNLNNLERNDKNWTNYIMGVIQQFNYLKADIRGFDCVFGGNIPIGAGLSSSAALECALSFALNKIFALNLTKIDLVKLSQKAENEFVGVKCGIMDQFISVFGKKDSVLKLDCRDLSYEY